MRIALLASPRTGSTSLYDFIANHLSFDNYIMESEPFNYYWRHDAGLEQRDTNFFSNQKNVFIKTFMDEGHIPFMFQNDLKSYWDWFFGYFDKIILLDRIDKISQSESLLYHNKQSNFKSWHKKEYYNLSNITKLEIEDLVNKLTVESQKLFEYSQNGYPIFFYEDIYLQKNKNKIIEMFEYIGITLNDELYKKYILSSELKVRKTLI